MPLAMDIFNDEAFGVAELTAAINNPPEGERVSNLIDSLFEEEGIPTTHVMIERKGDNLSLVPTADRGAPGDVTNLGGRDLIPFNTVHLPTQWSVMADEVLGVRAFGKVTELEMLQDRVNAKLAKARRRLEITLSYHRLGALTGKVLDADGQSELLNLFDRFQMQQQVQPLDLLNTSSDAPLKKKIKDAIRMSEDALTGETISGWMAICGRGFYDALGENKAIKTSFDRWNDGQFFREQQNGGFRWGDVEWKEYYSKVGGIEFIGADDAYLIPLGVPELFITRFAPANYVETVGTNGLPYYAKQELMPFGKGVRGEAQSNPLNLCTKPRAIIKLKKGNS